MHLRAGTGTVASGVAAVRVACEGLGALPSGHCLPLPRGRFGAAEGTGAALCSDGTSAGRTAESGHRAVNPP